MKQLSYKANSFLIELGRVIVWIGAVWVIVCLTLFFTFSLVFSHCAPAQLLIPYERSHYVQTLPQMQREWDREREAKKLIDYQVERQYEFDRRLERDREFEQTLQRLRRGY